VTGIYSTPIYITTIMTMYQRLFCFSCFLPSSLFPVAIQVKLKVSLLHNLAYHVETTEEKKAEGPIMNPWENPPSQEIGIGVQWG